MTTSLPRARGFAQVDVFSSMPYLGNPVAVVLDGRDLADEVMQRLVRWMNLSETTFVLPATSADADYRLRIFTPGGELPFAGHPTLGSAHAWLEDGGTPATPGRVVQQCQAGLVTLLRRRDALSFAAPPMLRTGPLEDGFLDEIVTAFGIDRRDVLAHQWVDNGPGWAVLQLPGAADVLALEPDLSRIPDVGFASLGSFSRTFTHVVGMSPSAYREAWRTGAATAGYVPTCVVMSWTRPSGAPQRSSFGEANRNRSP